MSPTPDGPLFAITEAASRPAAGCVGEHCMPITGLRCGILTLSGAGLVTCAGEEVRAVPRRTSPIH